jgi:hypothetical protein
MAIGGVDAEVEAVGGRAEGVAWGVRIRLRHAVLR